LGGYTAIDVKLPDNVLGLISTDALSPYVVSGNTFNFGLLKNTILHIFVKIINNGTAIKLQRSIEYKPKIKVNLSAKPRIASKLNALTFTHLHP
jgi:hypothetical protein